MTGVQTCALPISIFGIPICTLIFRNYYATAVPKEILEAAKIDGAGMWRIFRSVVLPVSAPAFVVTLIWQITSAWNDFLFALVLTRTEVTTYTVQVTHYFGGQSNFWAKIAAMSVLGTIPVFFTVAVMQRYLVRGISMGAVKG